MKIQSSNSTINNKENQKPFKILALDGGGVRGILPAQILALIEEKLNISIYENFDLIVGTSTGSIIAGAISTKYPLSKLTKKYAQFAPKIFKKSLFRHGFFKSKYSSKPLENFLKEVFEERKLGNLEKPLIINATNVSTGNVIIFKSKYQEEMRNGEDYTRDKKIPLFKAILASCSAPIYFNPVNIDGSLISDGGLWANNPSLVGYTDAIRNFNAKNIRIFSLGTGKTSISNDSSKWGWGKCSGWGGVKLVDLVMSCQTTFPSNILNLINKENTLRINPSIDDCPLDDYEKIPSLSALAQQEFNNRNIEIKNFLTLGGKSGT